jgi:hypothetical protein
MSRLTGMNLAKLNATNLNLMQNQHHHNHQAHE